MRSGYILLDEIINTAFTAIEVALSEDDSLQTSAGDVLVRLPLMQHFAKAITDMLFHPAWFVFPIQFIVIKYSILVSRVAISFFLKLSLQVRQMGCMLHSTVSSRSLVSKLVQGAFGCFPPRPAALSSRSDQSNGSGCSRPCPAMFHRFGAVCFLP